MLTRSDFARLSFEEKGRFIEDILGISDVCSAMLYGDAEVAAYTASKYNVPMVAEYYPDPILGTWRVRMGAASEVGHTLAEALWLTVLEYCELLDKGESNEVGGVS